MTAGLALGVDVGNAKVKVCVGSGRALADVRWLSRPLPYTDRAPYDRHVDFERGIPSALAELLGSAIDEVAVVALTMSSGYSYPSFHEGVVRTVELFTRLLPRAECFALAHDGSIVAADDVARGGDDVLGPLAFTNGLGAAHLAQRTAWLGGQASGLVLDTGGTSTQVTLLVDGHVEVAGRDDPAHCVRHLLVGRRGIWIGAQTTPLEALASEVPVAGCRLPVVPRGVTFDHVAAVLGLLDPDVARQLSLFGLAPSREIGLRAVADAVGLDVENAGGERGVTELARHFHELAVGRLAAGIRAALDTASCPLPRALAFGLGSAWLATPALLRAGFAEDAVAPASRFLPEKLSLVASCYGAFHVAAERMRGERLSADLSAALG
jgi:uncharacterized hydantoinase/oxoprolinase family protein